MLPWTAPYSWTDQWQVYNYSLSQYDHTHRRHPWNGVNLEQTKIYIIINHSNSASMMIIVSLWRSQIFPRLSWRRLTSWWAMRRTVPSTKSDLQTLRMRWGHPISTYMRSSSSISHPFPPLNHLLPDSLNNVVPRMSGHRKPIACYKHIYVWVHRP